MFNQSESKQYIITLKKFKIDRSPTGEPEQFKSELEKFNCRVDVVSDDVVLVDSIKIINPKKLICIETYSDHRIALAFSPLALMGFKLKIKNSNVIKKSYPNFFHDLIKFGVLIKNNF